MLSGEWHKANDHLKSLIMEDYVSIERKGLEPIDIDHYPGFIVLSNHDAPIRVEKGDGRIVCLDVSSRCKGNFDYFGRLAKILEHPDTAGSFMSYLLTQDLTGWIPEKNIPTTKMKTEMMRDQLPNPIRFIIDYITPWTENRIEKPSKATLFQTYSEWCFSNNEKNQLSNNIFGRKLSQIGILNKREGSGKREWLYILDRTKITTKLHEMGVNINDFSDSVENNGSETSDQTEIPVFNVSEKEEKDTENSMKTSFIPRPSTDVIQEIFHTENTKSPTNLLTKSSTETIKSSDINQDKDNSKPEPQPATEIVETPKIIEPEPEHIHNQMDSNEKPLPAIYPFRAEREAKLKEWAINNGENPNKFTKIRDEDKLKSKGFRDSMETYARMCIYAKEAEEDPKDYVSTKVGDRRDRLIGEEIIRRDLRRKESLLHGSTQMKNGNFI